MLVEPCSSCSRAVITLVFCVLFLINEYNELMNETPKRLVSSLSVGLCSLVGIKNRLASLSLGPAGASPQIQGRLVSDSFHALIVFFNELVSSWDSTKRNHALVVACPYYFTQLPGTNSCYKRESVSANWLDAQESCLSYHNKTHLVVIDNAAEDNALVSWLSGFEGDNVFYILLLCRLFFLKNVVR